MSQSAGVTRDLLAHPVRGVRCGGSAGVDMIHVARGRLDAYFEAPPDAAEGLDTDVTQKVQCAEGADR